MGGLFIDAYAIYSDFLYKSYVVGSHQQVEAIQMSITTDAFIKK